MEIQATFIYKNNQIVIQSKKDDEMKSMFEKFITKLNSSLNLNEFSFLYNGKELAYDSTIGKNPDIGDKQNISINVQKKGRNCKCPKCICNDCIINLNNYQVVYYGCKYDHKEVSEYDLYKNTQIINFNEMRCNYPNCPHTQQNYIYEFFKCITCTKLVGESQYYCYEHKDNHASGKPHYTVKYEDKNYYCEKHCDEFIKYCFTCKKNLCKDCVEEHQEHKIANYDEMSSDIDGYKKVLQKMENNIKDLDIVINNIKYKLDGTKRIFERYYDITKDIITKYITFNQKLKNYRALRTNRNLKFSNNFMMNDLDKIINEKGVLNRAKVIIETYNNKKERLQGKIYNSNDKIPNDDSDDDIWWEEIKEIKKKKREKELSKINEQNTKKKKNGGRK